MARINVKAADFVVPVHEVGARQMFSPVRELERLVGCCLLGERQFYMDGEDIAVRIKQLAAAEVSMEDVARIAVHARKELGLRHVPLLLLVVLAGRNAGPLARKAAADILRTPKDAMDLIALYWTNSNAFPLPHAFKAAIRDGFARWTEYQISKYATLTNVAVRLRDLAFLVHPRPKPEAEALFKALADDTLRAPDTWEAALSRPGADKCAEWERLLAEGKLGALALVRNLRNMEQVGVDHHLVHDALQKVKASDVWPWQALAAVREAPAYSHVLSDLMLRSCGTLPRLPGKTAVLVDVSGSMNNLLSAKGSMRRMDAAAGLAVVLREVCEDHWLATFSSTLVVLTEGARGAMLAEAIIESQPHQSTLLGKAVTETTRVAEFDRLVVLTDEQAQDKATFPSCQTFVINLASTSRGLAINGRVMRLNGWSGGVIRWLAAEVAGVVPAADEADDE